MATAPKGQFEECEPCDSMHLYYLVETLLASGLDDGHIARRQCVRHLTLSPITTRMDLVTYFALSTIDVVFVGRAESKLERELKMLCTREDLRSSHGIRIILITCSQQNFDTHDHSKLLVHILHTFSHSHSRKLVYLSNPPSTPSPPVCSCLTTSPRRGAVGI